MLAWVVITSELGYYSRWVGHQVMWTLSSLHTPGTVLDLVAPPCPQVVWPSDPAGAVPGLLPALHTCALPVGPGNSAVYLGQQTCTLKGHIQHLPAITWHLQVEKFLDARVGSTQSMAIRLITGLGGGTICAAAFPFLPNSHRALLWMVAVLGTVGVTMCGWAGKAGQHMRCSWYQACTALGTGGLNK
jgi:hypothetical protein